MTYCGSIGSVNVLEFMSTDLFDESQENPFLLHQSPFHATTTGLQPTSYSPPAVMYELPLDDVQPTSNSYGLKQNGKGFICPPPSPQKQEVSLHSATTRASAMLTSSSSGRPSVSFNLPRSILKRQSSYDSDLSTTPTVTENDPVSAQETELHKLLYSLSRFGLASDNAMPPPLPVHHELNQQQHQGSYNSHSSSRNQTGNIGTHYFSAIAERPELSEISETQRSFTTKTNTHINRNMSQRATRDAEPTHAYPSKSIPTNHSRGSVTFATVKNLLRGGGGAGASRTVRRASHIEQRKKSMGTVSSRLKRRQKFARPTILTEAYHRVSTMKLGTKPMRASIKHLAFPYIYKDEDLSEADPGMPAPRGQLLRKSLVLLETLDKIGTRAACPVHLIQEEAPDYSKVQARVDSHNHNMSPKKGLRRPSAWLMEAAMGATSPYDSY